MLGQVRAVHMNVRDMVPRRPDLAQTLNTVRWVTGLESRASTPKRSEPECSPIRPTVWARCYAMTTAASACCRSARRCVRTLGRCVGPRIYGAQGQLILAATPLVCLQNR